LRNLACNLKAAEALYQGATSVVPIEANEKAGFNPCWHRAYVRLAAYETHSSDTHITSSDTDIINGKGCQQT